MADSNYELIPYDFDTLKSEQDAKIKAKSEWANISSDDKTYQLFLYCMTNFASFLMGTINNTFLDYFPHISAADESIYQFANFIKMDIDRKISAIGKVNFSIPTAHTKQIIIPVGTEISNEDGSIILTTTSVYYINVGLTEITDCDVIQGQWKDIINTADGTNFQRYYVYDTIEETNLKVYVKEDDINWTEWTEVSNFYFSTDTDRHYIVKAIKNGYYILFNDGTFGMKPANGKEVKITYIQSSGYTGNIYYPNIVTTIIDTIYDADTNSVDNISVTNPAAIIGGSAEDSITEIKKNITAHFVTNPYITRKDDYKSYLLAHDYLLDANIYAGWEIFPSDNTKWATIYVYCCPTSSQFLTSAQKEVLYNYVKLKDIFISNICFEDATYISVYLNLTIKFKETIDLTQTRINEIKVEIGTLITDYFDFEKAMSAYGTVFRNIYHSEIIHTIMDNVSELRKINLELFSVEKVDDISENDTSFQITLQYEDLELLETYLYVDGECIGAFDGSWDLVPLDNSGSGGHDWTDSGWSGMADRISSEINNTTKIIGITILDTDLTDSGEADHIVGKTFYVRSAALNEDDLVTSHEEMIFEYSNHDITVES